MLFLHLSEKTPLLISGGAEGDILFWSPVSTGSTKPIHRLSPQSRAIEHLALDPFSSASSPAIYAAPSQRDIHYFTLPSTLADIKSTTLSPTPLVLHETSVYALHFDTDGDLWTCSADKTAKHTPRSETSGECNAFTRDILTTPPQPGIGITVITACRDENVRIWSASTGSLLHLFSGHYDEVTSLALVSLSSPSILLTSPWRSNLLHYGQQTMAVASVSIDGTVRTWDISPSGIEDANAQDRSVEAGGTVPDKPSTEHKQGNDFGLTDEEEAELRAIMEDEQD